MIVPMVVKRSDRAFVHGDEPPPKMAYSHNLGPCVGSGVPLAGITKHLFDFARRGSIPVMGSVFRARPLNPQVRNHRNKRQAKRQKDTKLNGSDGKRRPRAALAVY